SLNHEEQGKRIQDHGQDAVAEIIEDERPEQHPENAGGHEVGPDGLERARPEKQEKKPEHDGGSQISRTRSGVSRGSWLESCRRWRGSGQLSEDGPSAPRRSEAKRP